MTAQSTEMAEDGQNFDVSEFQHEKQSSAILGKRANRGYNPKYDSTETEFLTKTDFIKEG